MVLKLIPFHFPFSNVPIRKQNHSCGSCYISPDHHHSSMQTMTVFDFKVGRLRTLRRHRGTFLTLVPTKKN